MALKKFDKDKLAELPAKKEVIKQPPADTEKSVRELHPKAEEPAQAKETITRVTIEFPDSVYKAVKMKMLTDRDTIKDFMIRLVRKELNL